MAAIYLDDRPPSTASDGVNQQADDGQRDGDRLACGQEDQADDDRAEKS